MCILPCIFSLFNSRYGLSSLYTFQTNLQKVVQRFKKLLPEKSLFIWNSTMPVATNVHSKESVLFEDADVLPNLLSIDVLEANCYAKQVVVEYGFDFIDLHFYFRNQLQHRLRDGQHWDAIVHRRLSNLLLTHICQAWKLGLPVNHPLILKQKRQSLSQAVPLVSPENSLQNVQSQEPVGRWNYMLCKKESASSFNFPYGLNEYRTNDDNTSQRSGGTEAGNEWPSDMSKSPFQLHGSSCEQNCHDSQLQRQREIERYNNHLNNISSTALGNNVTLPVRRTPHHWQMSDNIRSYLELARQRSMPYFREIPYHVRPFSDSYVLPAIGNTNRIMYPPFEYIGEKPRAYFRYVNEFPGASPQINDCSTLTLSRHNSHDHDFQHMPLIRPAPQNRFISFNDLIKQHHNEQHYLTTVQDNWIPCKGYQSGPGEQHVDSRRYYLQ